MTNFSYSLWGTIWKMFSSQFKGIMLSTCVIWFSVEMIVVGYNMKLGWCHMVNGITWFTIGVTWYTHGITWYTNGVAWYTK